MATADEATESHRDPPAAGPKLTGLRLGLVALGLAAAFALKERVFWDPPLSFTVGADAESGVLHDWESAPDDASLPLRFSDGTLVTLEPKARARVVAIGRAGAQIVIESGRARVEVQAARFRVPGEAPWRVHLGDFSVEAESARFDVGWEPRADAFAVAVLDGSVTASGCDDGRSLQLGPSEGLSASCSQHRWQPVAATDALASVPTEPDFPSTPAPGAPGAVAAPAAPEAAAVGAR
jgi:hypothetical protein